MPLVNGTTELKLTNWNWQTETEAETEQWKWAYCNFLIKQPFPHDCDSFLVYDAVRSFQSTPPFIWLWWRKKDLWLRIGFSYTPSSNSYNDIFWGAVAAAFSLTSAGVPLDDGFPGCPVKLTLLSLRAIMLRVLKELLLYVRFSLKPTFEDYAMRTSWNFATSFGTYREAFLGRDWRTTETELVGL